MFGSIGMLELIIISAIALIIFGPTKLPELGKSLSEAIRGFKKAIDNSDKVLLKNSESRTTANESSKL
ncbi:MAG: twin-arginine translocase TatA/TatE family subunit [Deltaproteobacteria bacterium]|nr:twin-arginine translocase TatA/TatE family subunit [Deltaproteobacteria bacterium]